MFKRLLTSTQFVVKVFLLCLPWRFPNFRVESKMMLVSVVTIREISVVRSIVEYFRVLFCDTFKSKHTYFILPS